MKISCTAECPPWHRTGPEIQLIAARKRVLQLIAGVLLAAGFAIVSRQVYMNAKAALAAHLIDRSWAAEMKDGLPQRPWGWADLHPVARMEVPRLGVHRTILSGAMGSSLAFGLGHVSGTPLPGEPGNCGIAGHRDTWASFLKDVRTGDELRIETRNATTVYLVDDIEIVPKEQAEVLMPGADQRLTLVTCWPFTGLLHSPWRYVVKCRIVPRSIRITAGDLAHGIESANDGSLSIDTPR